MKAIAAMDLNRTIGYRGSLPWPPISDDLKLFKKRTMGCHLIMGRTTYDIVGDLPGRNTWVLTSNPDKYKPAAGAGKYFRHITYDYFTQNQMWKWEGVWLCGGAKTYQLLLPYCDEVFLTIVLEEYEGDAFMPFFEEMFRNSEILKETEKYWIVRYWK